MAPFGWSIEQFGKHVLKEYRSFIPLIMKVCGSNSSDKGVTSFRDGDKKKVWHELNIALATFRKQKIDRMTKENQNEKKTVIVLGLMETEYPNDRESKRTKGDDEVPLAVHRTDKWVRPKNKKKRIPST